ncbi:methylthioribulose 1-phosphate dehydratase [Saccharopolyspora sp. HNM0983]|uniref:Methylthioribulose-1-phosphate dehydratase n=1 Tax=Saccharopolyspora montiporae TaxID=2781240 RepID=A0A929FYT3_9PSEU|nr:methylthioribulose 1-phosphate dehydratase [Saccharopolyspora sp. HNM0983]MBE9376146.1 methylthioribulose 1-phosphate dehydratase [Saccharopolyspora sp. HNM0983]
MSTGSTVDTDELHRAGHVLAAESARYAALGWMRGSSGNLSQVLRHDPLQLAVTASGLDKGELTDHDVVAVDRTGAAVPGQPHPQRPSAEAGLHARIAEVSGAGAVVHVHALSAVLAAHHWPAGVVLSDLEMLKGLGRTASDTMTVPVVDNSQDMHVLGDTFHTGYDPATPALIVARHGLYVWGRDVREARHRTECLDWLLQFTLSANRPEQEAMA